MQDLPHLRHSWVQNVVAFYHLQIGKHVTWILRWSRQGRFSTVTNAVESPLRACWRLLVGRRVGRETALSALRMGLLMKCLRSATWISCLSVTPFSVANISSCGSDSRECASDSDHPGLFCSRTSFSCTLAAPLTRKRKSPQKMGLRKKKKTRIKKRHQEKCCLEVRCSFEQGRSFLTCFKDSAGQWYSCWKQSSYLCWWLYRNVSFSWHPFWAKCGEGGGRVSLDYWHVPQQTCRLPA